jgi:hypothetical protein
VGEVGDDDGVVPWDEVPVVVPRVSVPVLDAPVVLSTGDDELVFCLLC